MFRAFSPSSNVDIPHAFLKHNVGFPSHNASIETLGSGSSLDVIRKIVDLASKSLYAGELLNILSFPVRSDLLI